MKITKEKLSAVSNSRYRKIEIGSESLEIRISDHPLPPSYEIGRLIIHVGNFPESDFRTISECKKWIKSLTESDVKEMRLNAKLAAEPTEQEKQWWREDAVYRREENRRWIENAPAGWSRRISCGGNKIQTDLSTGIDYKLSRRGNWTPINKTKK